MVLIANVCHHPVATRDCPLSKRPTSRLGCMAWLCTFPHDIRRDKYKVAVFRHRSFRAVYHIADTKHGVINFCYIGDFVEITRSPNGTSDMVCACSGARRNQNIEHGIEAFCPVVYSNLVLVNRETIRPVSESGLITQAINRSLRIIMTGVNADEFYFFAITPFMFVLKEKGFGHGCITCL